MFSDEMQTKKLSDVPWRVSTFRLRRPHLCFSVLTQELLTNAYEKVSRCSPTHNGLNRSAIESRTNTSFTVTVDKQLYDSSVSSAALKDLSGDDFIGKLCSSLFIFVAPVWYY